MGTTRYTDGNVTITLDDGLEKWCRSILDEAQREMVTQAETEAQAVADAAKGQWYEQVQKRSGKSGDITVVTTFDAARDVVRVTVGSTDTRLNKGKPVAVLVHRPSSLSQIATEITRREYSDARAAGRSKDVVHARRGDKARGIVAGKFYRFSHNPKAADGKNLMVELIRKPFTLRLKKAIPNMARVIADRVNRGGP